MGEGEIRESCQVFCSVLIKVCSVLLLMITHTVFYRLTNEKQRLQTQHKRMRVSTAKHTYCFDALMKDRFMDEVEFAKFPDEFNVAKHLDLGNGTLLLLLRSKRVVMFVIDW